MRMSRLHDANARMLAHAPSVRPVSTGDIIRTHRKKFPYRGFAGIDSPYCPPFVMFCVNDDAVALDTLWNGRFGYEPGSLSTRSRLAARSTTIAALGEPAVDGFTLEHAAADAELKRIRLRTLDEVFADTRLDLVKIDVEGHEPAVLRGAREVLRRDRPTVMLEALRDAPLETLTARFDPLGYDCHWVTEADGTLVPWHEPPAPEDPEPDLHPAGMRKRRAPLDARRAAPRTADRYSTVTDFARLRGLSMSRSRAFAV
ncbi:FkbM family methyltransferase [Streptomyces griseoruber]|nr:FkbM family methyltransferase [Streptomyces griseoruber]